MNGRLGISVSVHVLFSLITLPFLSLACYSAHKGYRSACGLHEVPHIRLWLSVPTFMAHLVIPLRIWVYAFSSTYIMAVIRVRYAPAPFPNM
jgi:hypothetical protein